MVEAEHFRRVICGMLQMLRVNTPVQCSVYEDEERSAVGAEQAVDKGSRNQVIGGSRQ